MMNAPAARRELPVLSSTPVDAPVLYHALAAAVEGEVRFGRLDRALYSTDASVYQIVPLGVVIPKTEADVQATLRICAQFGVPITARGGGTSQAGQAVGAGVQLDFSKYLHAILEINTAERWVRVQPGCVLDDLNAAVKPHGLHFPHDVSTADRATLGGMVANNSSGTRSVLYGKTIDHVLELRVLLSDGSVVEMRPLDEIAWRAKCEQRDLEGECYRTVGRLAAEHAAEIERRYPKIIRRVGGYNLDAFVAPFSRRSAYGAGSPAPFAERRLNMAHLLVGSEGTLGLVLEAKLRLEPLPKAKALLVLQFADLLDALRATPLILEHGPAAIEVIDRYVLDSTRLNPEASRLRDFLQGDPAAILIVEFYGDRADELSPRVDALEADVRQRGFAGHMHRAADAAAQGRVWKLRKMALGLSMAQKGDAKAMSFVEDTAVDASRLRDFIAEFLQVIARHGTSAGVYAHASVGCLHVRPVINLKTEVGVRQFEAIANDVADLVLKYGGALSGEHGDGLVRSPFMERMFGPALYGAFGEIKRTFDPHNLLNPGKIVDAPPLTVNLRYGPAYVTPDVPTTFDFAADGGLTQAAELCAGVGACRKKRDGTMCPSYQATREEQHSTRGRANALRLALTGQLGFGGLDDPALKEVFDLCLECKACKAECPTNVDMARLKAEWLDQHHRKHGLPWRSWVFGNVARLSSWGRWMTPLANGLTRSRAGRWLGEVVLGVDRRRLPPRLARGGFRCFLEAGYHSQAHAARHDLSADVFFFLDTFTMNHEPAIGMAGAELLHALKYRAVIWQDDWPPKDGPHCCGRPFISNGMLGQAVAAARHNVERLHQWAAEGKPIITCEPSCILTIKDDYPALLRGEQRKEAETVAAMCMTFEEFVESQLASGVASAPRAGAAHGALTRPRSPLTFRPGPKRILVHAHCHQRALVGVEPILRLLRRIPGAEVIDLDAGCCGMAGSFGYEKEHYELSRQVGEQRLFPAVRQADADTAIVASGFSCRLQIEHFTGRKAVHPAVLLRSLLEESPAV